MSRRKEHRFTSFADFWPHYLAEHSRPATRALHIAGTLLGSVLLVMGMIDADWRLVVAGLIVGYAIAWIAHWRIEKNRPATFQHPLWSLAGDFRMLGLWLTGRLAAEVARQEARREAL